MANYNRGSQHSMGYVAGSFWEGLCAIAASVACFVFVFKVSSSLISLCLFFASVSCAAFAVFSFAMFANYYNFGSGSGGKIINSKNMKPSQNPSLYSSTNKVSTISLIVCLVAAAIAIIFLLIAHPWSR